MTGFLSFVVALVLATAFAGSTLDQGHVGLIVGWGCVAILVAGLPMILVVLAPVGVAIILGNDYGVTDFTPYCIGLAGGFTVAAILNGLRPNTEEEEEENRS